MTERRRDLLRDAAVVAAAAAIAKSAGAQGTELKVGKGLRDLSDETLDFFPNARHSSRRHALVVLAHPAGGAGSCQLLTPAPAATHPCSLGTEASLSGSRAASRARASCP